MRTRNTFAAVIVAFVAPFLTGRSLAEQWEHAAASVSTVEVVGGGLISIPEAGNADPYPSSLAVSGITGAIVAVRVKLNGFSHAYPADVLAYLEGPGGEVVDLLSFQGGSNSVDDLNLVFSDLAVEFPAEPLTSGTFRPGGSLLTLASSGANGTWNLYVSDSARPDEGAIASWSLEFDVSTAQEPEIVVQAPGGSNLVSGGEAVTLGTAGVGVSLAEKTFTIRNFGLADLMNLSVTVAGANRGDFAVTQPNPTSVGPGGSVSASFSVTFTPSAMGQREAILEIASNDPDENPFVIAVSGIGSFGTITGNDDFSDRADLGIGSSVLLDSTVTGATLEVNELRPGGYGTASVWFQWSAPASGWYQINVNPAGGGEDLILGLFEGSGSLGQLEMLGFNRSAQFGFLAGSQLVFFADAGTVHQVAVYSDAVPISGDFELSIQTIPAPDARITSLSVDPPSVDVTSAGASVTLNGTAQGDLFSSSPSAILIAPGLPGEVESDLPRIYFGFIEAGDFQLPVTLPRYARPGEWIPQFSLIGGISWTPVGDDLVEDHFLIPAGPDQKPVVVNTGTVDLQPPVLVSVTGLPANSVNVTTNSQPITVQLRVQDALAGLTYGYVYLVDALGGTVANSYLYDGVRISGNPQDGTYHAELVVPQDAFSGKYHLSFYFEDETGNSTSFERTDLAVNVIGAPAAPLLLVSHEFAELPNLSIVDLGTAGVGGSTATQLTLRNIGLGDLTISEITIGGPNIADFGISATSALTFPVTLASGELLNFDVTFSPSATGARGALLEIFSNDPGNPFTLQLQGTGSNLPTPEIAMSGNGNPILDGSTTPNSANHTDFGSVAAASGTVTRTFTIHNSGSAALNLTGPAPNYVTLSGPGSAAFTVTAQPASATLAANTGTATFTIAFDPAAASIYSATVSVANSDGDENPFEFAIQGAGTNSAPADLFLSSASIAENAVNAVVGALSASDLDSGDSHTFALVAGTGSGDNGSFVIDGNALNFVGSADFETKSSYLVRIAATDNGLSPLSTSKAFVISVSNINEPPVFTKGTNQMPPPASTSPQSITGWATGIDDGDSTVVQNLTFSVSVSGAAIFSQAPAIAADGTLSYTPNGTPGVATVSVSLTDDNSINGSPAITSGSQSFTITVTAPEIAVSGQSMNIENGDATPSTQDGTDFGTVAVAGGIAQRTFIITNGGDAPLSLGALTIEGAGAGDFSAAALPASVDAGDSTSFGVTFDSSAAGTRSAMLRIVNGDGNENPFTFAIQGIGSAPEIAVSGQSADIENGDDTPSTVDGTDFGAVAIAGGTTQQTFTITNGGDAPLSLGALTIEGAGAGDFSAAALPASVDAGDSTSFAVTFDPSAVGTRSAMLRIVNGDGNENPFTFAIQGTGSVAEIAVSGNSVPISSGDLTPDIANHTNFGSVSLLNAQLTRTFTITNPGAVPLRLTGAPRVAISGPDAGDFSVTTLPASTVAPGASTTFAITFDPALPDSRTAMVSLQHDAVESPFTFVIAGFGSLTTSLTQSISFAPPGTVYLSQSPLILQASASSGLPVALNVLSGPATLDNSVLTITGPGTIRVKATQPGEGNYGAAAAVIRSIVAKADPTTLTLIHLNQTYDGQPKPIDITGADEATITYIVSGVEGETPPTAAGRYRVKAVAGSVVKTGTLVIAKAPLTVTPDDQRKFAGQPNPVLTAVVSGFVGSDTEQTALSRQPVLSTRARGASGGGQYPITASGGAAANYSFIYLQGTLVVESFVGTYEALLRDGDSLDPVAKLAVTVAKSNTTFSARLFTETSTSFIGLSGPLTTDSVNEEAEGEAEVQVRSGSIYRIEFTLPLGGDAICSAAQDGEALGSASNGKKLASFRSVPYAGAHTAILQPAFPTADDLPKGAGWATASVAKTGVLTLRGRLGDGTSFTTAAAPDGEEDPGYRLFAQPYKPPRTGTYVAGEFALAPHPDLANRRFLEGSPLSWVKREFIADKSYRDGFPALSTSLSIDPWLPPAAATRTAAAISLAERLDLSAPAFFLVVEHSDSGSVAHDDLPTVLALSARNALSVIAPVTSPANITKWKATVVPRAGTFSGSFELIDSGVKRAVSFSGVLRQDPSSSTDGGIGQGHYLLPPLPNATSNETATGGMRFSRPAPLAP